MTVWCIFPSWTRIGVERVEDVVSVGDAVIVKVMDIKDGKISLSRKDALEELEARRKQQAEQ